LYNSKFMTIALPTISSEMPDVTGCVTDSSNSYQPKVTPCRPGTLVSTGELRSGDEPIPGKWILELRMASGSRDPTRPSRTQRRRLTTTLSTLSSPYPPSTTGSQFKRKLK